MICMVFAADGYIQLGAEYINGRYNPIYDIAQNLGILNKVDDDDGGDPIEDGILASGIFRITFLQHRFSDFQIFLWKFIDDAS